MSQLDQQILDTYREIRRQDKVKRHLRELEKKMADLTNSIEAKHKELDQIEQRLKWLETAPLRTMKEWLWKNRKEQYDDWKAGYFDRVMEYKALVKEKELCAFEYDILKGQIVNVKEKEASLKRMLNKKAIEVLTEKGPANEALRDLYEEMTYKFALIEEIREAYFHGEKALHALNGLLKRLSIAKMDQGNAQFSSQTHLLFYLEGAQSEIDETYSGLQRYILELKDISSEEPVEDYDDLLTAESFIGNLYRALLNYPNPKFVQKSINRLVKIKNRLLKSNEQLQKELGFTERSLNRMYRKRDLLLVRDSRLDLRGDDI